MYTYDNENPQDTSQGDPLPWEESLERFQVLRHMQEGSEIVRKILILWSPTVGRIGWEERAVVGHWKYSVIVSQSQVWKGGRQ